MLVVIHSLNQSFILEKTEWGGDPPLKSVEAENANANVLKKYYIKFRSNINNVFFFID